MDPTLKDMVTLGLAAIGAVLGIMNTWNAISQRRVRLHVSPAFLLRTDGSPIMFSIEAINLSTFPLTLVEVGFRSENGKKIVISGAQSIDGKSLPRRLEAREAVTLAFGPANFFPPKGYRIGPAYIHTACGRTISGDSPARKQFAEMIADLQKGSL